MSDLIDRQKVIDSLKMWLNVKGYNEGEINMLKACINELESVPSAQPERKTGRWIMHIDDLFTTESTMECSECHEHQPLTCDDNFCPNCGARMEVDNERK